MLKVIRDIAESIFQRNLSIHPFIHAETNASQHGVFRAVTRSSAGTTIIAQPKAMNDSIILTDLMFTTDKVNGATATVRFTDGTNTINIIAADVTDAPCNIGIGFSGHWHGWGGARLELVTTGVVVATAALGYMRLGPDQTNQSYAEWNALR